jgi:hypothetical protein
MRLIVCDKTPQQRGRQGSSVGCSYVGEKNVEVEWLTIPFRTSNVPGSNLGPETAILTEVYRSSSQSLRSRVSSGSIVSDYGLDDRAIGVRSQAGAKDFSSNLCVQTGSGVHPASCTVGTGGPFPEGKARPGRDANHSPLSSAEVVNE